MALSQQGNLKKDDLFVQELEEINSNSVKIHKAKIDKRYDVNFSLDNDRVLNSDSLRTIPELVWYLENNPQVELEADVLAFHKQTGEKTILKLNAKQFCEGYKHQEKKSFNFKEGFDYFASDSGYGYGGTEVGVDYVPLLGGPFFRQMYLQDMLKSHQQSFYAFHHDPIAKQAVEIIKDFTLGKGFRVDCKNTEGLVLWRAFEEANKLDDLFIKICYELSIYGEILLWELPNFETKFGYQLQPGQEVPKGLLPRFKLIDPSTCWDICTYPEDQDRVLFYQLIYPTQYQMFTGSDGGKPVTSTKFIYKQIPAEQVDHFKINVVSNEKRGRSDLYPILGYLKRLRDAVNYSLIGLMKQATWAIDTSIDGNQTDIDSYNEALSALGDFAPPGSEFVHSTKIKREFLASQAGNGSGKSQTFDWVFSMVASGVGIPQSYFCTHHNAGSTRASAIVATEPVAKKFESRQKVLENILKAMAKRLFNHFDIRAEIEVTFPDIITQDRSAKLKDLTLAEGQKWISPRRAAEIASKELGITEYDFEAEQKEISEEIDLIPELKTLNPLTAEPSNQKSPSPLSGEEKRTVKDANRKL